MRHTVRSFLLVATGIAIACGGRVQGTGGGAGNDGGSGGGSGSGSTSSSGAAGSSSGSGSSSGGAGSSSGIDGSGSSSGIDGSSSGSGSSSGVVSIDAGGLYDGTTGKACTSDADCQSATGPDVNKCTNDVIFEGGALFPTPVCLLPAECDPGTDGGIHYCDGPDDPSSPGVCLPTTVPAATGMGVCLPQCNFKPDGSPATGCVGKDTCSIYGIGADASGNPLGIGYCYAGCASDADCSAAGTSGTPQHCQVDEGVCVTTVATDSPAGTGCSSASTTATCNCISNSTTNLGYCGQFCRTGGAACPSGSLCDASLPATLTNAADASVAGWTSANAGMGGYCAPLCSTATGKTTTGGACPPNSTCQAGDLGGPDCLP